MKVTTTCEQDYLRVYFDETLHLSIYIGDLAGIQAWHESSSWYCITYYCKSRAIPTQYSSRELWQEILKQIEEFV